jgi:hypothetical protein
MRGMRKTSLGMGGRSMPMLSRARGDAPAVRPRESDHCLSVPPGKAWRWRHCLRSPDSPGRPDLPSPPWCDLSAGAHSHPHDWLHRAASVPRNAAFSHPSGLHRSSERCRDRSDAPVRSGFAVWLSGAVMQTTRSRRPAPPRALPRTTWANPKAMMLSRGLPVLWRPLGDALMLEGAGIGIHLDRASPRRRGMVLDRRSFWAFLVETAGLQLPRLPLRCGEALQPRAVAPAGLCSKLTLDSCDGMGRPLCHRRVAE